ncbi:MAG: SLBB domain-containing protein [Acidobacteriaceae bacterium]|nr:SLBB domain-containing protein [Acidobacteriaceae bacterium]MBV9781856.1 SLBB domain-containing protein [Acidobacteriaceae bacterium]
MQLLSAPSLGRTPGAQTGNHLLLRVLVLCCFSLVSLPSFLIAQSSSMTNGQAGFASRDQQAEAARLADIYRIHPDDELDLYVVDVPEYSRSYRVAPDGTIRLPLLNEPIVAAGETPAALGGVIASKLATVGLLNNPHVLVEVKRSRADSISISGAVKQPQNYEVFGRTSLLSVVSQAGGLADDASNTAVITRGEIAKRVLEEPEKNPAAAHAPNTLSVNLKRAMQGVASENVELYPGDAVMVQRAGIVYVVGAVNRAGGFVMNGDRSSMTVLKAVALAEDLKPSAQGKKAVIIRKDATQPNGAEEIRIDLNKILANKAPDTTLTADDVLFIPDSTAKKALHRSGQALAEMATMLSYGALIYK